MYLRVDADDKIRQLEDLETLIIGYQLALSCLEVGGSDAVFLDSFGKYVHATRGWSMACGPIGAIIANTESGNEAWATFWDLMDAYYRSLLGAPD